jgi:hypothetical protein
LRNAVVFDEHLLPIAERLLKFQPNDPLAKKMVVDLKARSQQNPSASSTIKAVATNPPQQSGNGAAVEFVERFRRIDARQIELPHSTIGPNRFCVAAGLALQALQLGPLQTNLAPAEKGGVFGLLKSRKRTCNCSWGIDLGCSALKAIQLEHSAAGGHVVAVKLAGRDRKGWAELDLSDVTATGTIDADPHCVRAKVPSSGQAIPAMTANDVSLCCDNFTRDKIANSTADLLDYAHEFMSDHHRDRDGLLRPGVPVIYMYVGAAD